MVANGGLRAERKREQEERRKVLSWANQLFLNRIDVYNNIMDILWQVSRPPRGSLTLKVALEGHKGVTKSSLASLRKRDGGIKK